MRHTKVRVFFPSLLSLSNLYNFFIYINFARCLALFIYYTWLFFRDFKTETKPGVE